MLIFADTNITAPAVRALRNAGHDVVHSAERAMDPGDAALLAEAAAERRIFLTKDHDIGRLVFSGSAPHVGVLLTDDVGNAADEAALLLTAIEQHGADLEAGAFLRLEESGRVRRGAL